MPDSVEQRLAALPTLTKAALHDLWMHLFQSTPPSPLRRDLMIPILAYRIQGQAFGSLSARAQERLRQLSRGFEKGSDLIPERSPRIRPGTTPPTMRRSFKPTAQPYEQASKDQPSLPNTD